MNREEKIKQLYLETYEDDNVDEISIEEMEESLEQYYLAAGFNITTVDDLFNNHEVDPKFVEKMEEKIKLRFIFKIII